MSESLPEVYLARHGETAWTLSHQHTGRTDIPLTARGEANARSLGERLKGEAFERVFVSPLGRARRTCELAGFGAQARPEPDLSEWDYGTYDGLTTAEIRRQRPGWDLFRDGCPGGETVAAAAGRARGLLAELTAAGDGRLLLFSHGHQLRILTACHLGLPPETARHLFLGTASLSVLGDEHEWPAILLWNEQEGSGAHLAEAGTTGWRGVPRSGRTAPGDRPEAGQA